MEAAGFSEMSVSIDSHARGQNLRLIKLSFYMMKWKQLTVAYSLIAGCDETKNDLQEIQSV
jgi:hypothetical protein